MSQSYLFKSLRLYPINISPRSIHDKSNFIYTSGIYRETFCSIVGNLSSSTGFYLSK